MNSKISDKDKKDWKDFLSSTKSLPDKDSILIKKTKKNLTFDFHGYTLDRANQKIKNLIHDAYEKDVTKLTVVTGKGLHSQNDSDPYVSKDLGILKYSIPEYIKKDTELMSMINYMEDANIEDGGSGAFYIYLKKKMIIWLPSYPKSGNTFLRSILSSYFFSKDGEFDFSFLRKIPKFPNKNLFKKFGIDINNEEEIAKNYIKI